MLTGCLRHVPAPCGAPKPQSVEHLGRVKNNLSVVENSFYFDIITRHWWFFSTSKSYKNPILSSRHELISNTQGVVLGLRLRRTFRKLNHNLNLVHTHHTPPAPSSLRSKGSSIGCTRNRDAKEIMPLCDRLRSVCFVYRICGKCKI